MISRPAPWTILLVLMLLAAGATPAAAVIVPATAPRWEVEAESGVLWKVGGGATPLSYTLVPQIISFKISPSEERLWAGGTLRLRSRFNLLLEPILHGPERYFAGVAASGELEWCSASRRVGAFFTSGGGFGWMNARGYEVAGAQGQDFNFNWLVHTGARCRVRGEWWLSGGLYFQHISNGHLNKINPGLNALGPTLGLARKF